MIFPQKFAGVPRTLQEDFCYGKEKRCCGAAIVCGRWSQRAGFDVSSPCPRLRELLEARQEELRGGIWGILWCAVIEAPDFRSAEGAVVDADIVDGAGEGIQIAGIAYEKIVGVIGCGVGVFGI
jgi:hypothetical protein